MLCPNCGHENPEGAKFCVECGAAQPRRCSSCSTALPPGSKFCPECGTPTQPAAAPAVVAPLAGAGVTGPPHRADVAEPERRQMTVLFADLVGSTDMSTVIDAEDYREIIARYIEAVERVVRSYDGYVANYLGDGLLVYFGYPKAHEDDSRRACLAALDIVAAVRALDVDVSGLDARLAVRVGVHTGPALIGAVGGKSAREGMAVGETLNLAARLQSMATPNSAVISAATERLVRRFVRTSHLGARPLKGIPDPVDVYELIEVRDESAAIDAGHTDLSPLVGRDLELEVIRGRWEESRRGKGRVVVIVGEAGLGKSRLVRTLHDGMAPPCTWLRCRATPFFADTPLRPVTDALPSLWSGDPDGVPRDLAQLSAFLDRLGLHAVEAAPLFGVLLGIPVSEERMAALQLSPQIARKRTLELLVELLLELARRCPMVVVFEDTHWLDETTLELADLLSERAASAPLLLVLAGRPPFQPPLIVDSEIALRRLPRDQVEALMRNVAAGGLANDLVAAIAERADGNPLYVEELTRNVLETGARRPPGADGRRSSVLDTVPASLQELLMARLDRTSADRTVVQGASAVGRVFSYDVLRQVVPIPDDVVTRELERHVEDGLLYRRGTPPDATYTFRHALLRDAVYESMTRRARQHYHRGIASVLKRSSVPVPPEVLAYHCTEAGDTMEAAEYWNAAGQAALESFALTEAMNHLHRGLALIEGDDRPDAVLAEVHVRTTLGVPLMLTQGFASPAVGDNYRRLLDRARQVAAAATDSLFPALWGMWTYYEVGVQLPLARQMGERLLDLADELQDSGVRLAGHIAYGAARMLLGSMPDARQHLERGLAVYDRAAHGPLAKLFGQDGGAMCCSFLTWVHAHEGEDERGRQRAVQALEMSRQLRQPATRGFVGAVVASFYCLTGDYEQGERQAREVIELGERQGMPHWAAQGRCNLGWALTGQGHPDDAVEPLRAGLAGLGQGGARAATSYFRAALVEAELRRGNLDDAGAAMADLRAFVEESDERFYESAMWRLDAELALARNGPEDGRRAEESLRRAIQVAEAQGAEGLARRAREPLSLLRGTV